MIDSVATREGDGCVYIVDYETEVVLETFEIPNTN